MEAEQDAGAKGIASPSGAADVVGRELQRGLPKVVTFAGAGEGAFWEMDYNQFTNSLLEQCAGCMTESDGVQSAIWLTYLEARGFAGFDFVEDAVVHVLEGGSDNFGEAIAVLADDIDAGFDLGGSRVGEQAGGFGTEFGVWLIKRVEQSPDYPMQLMLGIYEFPAERSDRSVEPYPKVFTVDYVRASRV